VVGLDAMAQLPLHPAGADALTLMHCSTNAPSTQAK
jgi:hypothetical protein